MFDHQIPNVERSVHARGKENAGSSGGPGGRCQIVWVVLKTGFWHFRKGDQFKRVSVLVGQWVGLVYINLNFSFELSSFCFFTFKICTKAFGTSFNFNLYRV